MGKQGNDDHRSQGHGCLEAGEGIRAVWLQNTEGAVFFLVTWMVVIQVCALFFIL